MYKEIKKRKQTLTKSVMKETPTTQQVHDFFQLEEQDWQLVKQASLNGDEEATLVLSLLRMISETIDEQYRAFAKVHQPDIPASHLQQIDEGNRILEYIAKLIQHRRAILYEDYRVLEKRMHIYIATIQRQMIGHPIFDIIIN